jgi:hypothetical protein
MPMEARPVTHPRAAALKAFGLGKLDESAAAVVLRHLESCPDCRQQVAALSGDDFLQRLRQAHGWGDTPAPGQTDSEGARNLPPELATHPQYEMLRELGRGGMGVVYLARNRLLARLEVLKVVNPDLLDSSGGKERFLREMQSAAMLSHPNVVAAYSAMQLGCLLVFAMEYIDGEDLAQRVKAHGPLPVVHACYYAQQVALGLQHAFEKQMVHRDIKPQNLILLREGKKHVVKILDFGLAKASSEKRRERELTASGAMLGTPDYMAPEQIMDAANADIRADIYSLGCTLYYLLSGRPPFQADSLYQLLYAHQEVEAPLLHQVRAEVPAKLALVVSKMMAKQPRQRYQTPVEVAQALTPFIQRSGTGSTSVGAPGASRGANAESTAKQERLPGQEPAVAWPTITESQSAASKPPKATTQPQRVLPAAKTATRKKWLLAAGIATALLVLGLLSLWVSSVLKVKTKEGVLVVEVDEPDAELFVDGEKVKVTWGKDGKTAEFGVQPGTRKVEVKKEGFVARGEDVEVQEGGRALFRARLEPAPQPGQGEAPQPGSSLRPLNRVALVRAGPWSIEGDQLVQSDAAMPFPDIMFGDYEWTDFDFSVQAKRTDGNDFFALYCRWFDRNAFKYSAGVFGNRQAALHRLLQDEWTVVHQAPFALQKDVLYKAVLNVRGNHYQALINDQVITDYQDPDNVSGQGRVGLGTNVAACRFKSIEVRSAAGKLLWTGPPDIDPPKPAAADKPVGVGLEPLEQTAPKQGAAEAASPSRTLSPGSVLVGVSQNDTGLSSPVRIEITERTGNDFKGSTTWDGFYGMRKFALAGTVQGNEVKWELGNLLWMQGKGRTNANNYGFAGNFERGTLEGRYATHDDKFKGMLKLNLAAVYTGTYQRVTGAAAKGELRIEITERQERHFKGTLTIDDGPTTWVITGTVGKDEVQWQWWDMVSKNGTSSENLTNNCRFTGTCKDSIVQGRFSTLDNTLTGSLKATLVGRKAGAGKQ